MSNKLLFLPLSHSIRGCFPVDFSVILNVPCGREFIMLNTLLSLFAALFKVSTDYSCEFWSKYSVVSFSIFSTNIILQNIYLSTCQLWILLGFSFAITHSRIYVPPICVLSSICDISPNREGVASLSHCSVSMHRK